MQAAPAPDRPLLLVVTDSELSHGTGAQREAQVTVGDDYRVQTDTRAASG